MLNTVGQVTRLVSIAERKVPHWRFFFHPMASAENTMQAWSAMPVHPVRGWYLKECFYKGDHIKALRNLIIRAKENDSISSN